MKSFKAIFVLTGLLQIYINLSPFEGKADVFPRTMVAYYKGFGNGSSEIDSFLLNPGKTRFIMLAAFDFVNGNLLDCENQGFPMSCFNQTLLDRFKSKKIEVYVDIAKTWGRNGEEYFYRNFDRVENLLIKLAQWGVSGFCFDETQSSTSSTSYLSPQKFQRFMNRLKSVSATAKVIVHETTVGAFDSWLAAIPASQRPHYISATWYLGADPSGTFLQVKALREKYKVGAAFWVDPLTFSKITPTYESGDLVLVWNLCWRSTTCQGVGLPFGQWFPWSSTRSLLDSLGPGSTPIQFRFEDVNQNGAVNAVDHTLVVQAILGSASGMGLTDVDRSGRVNVYDAELVSNCVLGKCKSRINDPVLVDGSK